MTHQLIASAFFLYIFTDAGILELYNKGKDSVKPTPLYYFHIQRRW